MFLFKSALIALIQAEINKELPKCTSQLHCEVHFETVVMQLIGVNAVWFIHFLLYGVKAAPTF